MYLIHGNYTVVLTLYMHTLYYFQLKGDTSNGVDALKKHPKIRSVTPQKRVERFLKSVEGTGNQNTRKLWYML